MMFTAVDDLQTLWHRGTGAYFYVSVDKAERTVVAILSHDRKHAILGGPYKITNVAIVIKGDC